MTELPRSIDAIDTPAAVVDVDRMHANLQRAAEYCRAHGLAWRPHAKTHKTPALAAAQVRAGAVGVTVATPREAEAMATAVDDLLLAYPPIGRPKLQRLMALPEHVRLTVGLDSAEALAGLAEAARAAGRRVGVLVEVDAGMGRVGVQSSDDALALVRAAAETDGVEYRGIMFYPGHVRMRVEAQDAGIRALSERVGRTLEALHAAGVAPGVVSGGSTPTFWRSHEIEGLTEVRPGTNIFNDRTTAEIGACAWDECAYSVLATVVSTSVPGQVVVDAGAKALSKEEIRADVTGYGALLDRPDVIVKSVSEEHGIIDLSGTDWRPRIGERVRIVPNHVCVSVNLHERLYGVRGEEVVDAWEIAGRGR
ncbi:D-TA family PLP-dependent enzyme [Longimicrobium sp.]|uniref:D-TA family PLP-dependent enzyme n=1 Tax=Longimicrobium sp. TaxID=2029185 RepID=UPI002E336B86|nr:D-TA family PLP-dependent enzyme [Longimicrobium sp.]HEX6041164.1 D-TA family PLP-dependent enzyme [Longimicrobium sp.]